MSRQFRTYAQTHEPAGAQIEEVRERGAADVLDVDQRVLGLGPHATTLGLGDPHRIGLVDQRAGDDFDDRPQRAGAIRRHY